MIAWMIARIGLPKDALGALAALALAALVGLFFWLGLGRIDAMVSDAATRARIAAIAERDAHWRAEIAASNAAVAREQAAQAVMAAAADARASAEIDRLKGALTDLEKKNAALPDGDRCGVDRDRIRLLNRP